MNLRTEENGNEVVVFVEGKMDTNTSPQVTEEITRHIEDADIITLDLEKLAYISSAGLRVFLLADQQMKDKGGEFHVRNVSRDIMDIFEMTGFDSMLNIV